MESANSSEQWLARAVHLHRQGNTAEAIKLYEKVVQKLPRHAPALNLLGLAYFQNGQPALAVQPLQTALMLAPDLPAGNYNLGRILHELKRYEEARRQYEAALARSPDDAEIHSNLGVLLRALDRSEQAVPHFRRALELKPEYGEAWINLGNALHELKRYEDACAAFARAAGLMPWSTEAQMNWGVALFDLGRYGEAVDRYRRVLAAQPEHAGAALNLADALRKLGEFEEAMASYQLVISQNPGNGQAHIGLGAVFEWMDRYDEAREHYGKAAELLPDDPRPKWFKVYLELSRGHLAQGWASFEARWAGREMAPRPYPQPRWDGSPLDGKLLVWGEQGLGDQILYAGLIGDLRRYTRSICLEVEPRLVPLFARSFPQVEVVPLGDELYGGRIDAQVPVAGLAPLLRSDWKAFQPVTEGFLKADPARVAELRARLAGDGRRVIGLSWQSTNRVVGAAKSAELRDFAAILRMSGCRFVDLQYGDTAAERAAIANELGIEVDRLDEIDNRNDIDALAALMSACDIVLSVSNTNAHLAAALGRPTWVLLPVGAARLWYWFHDRDDSPWYPRVRLIRRVRGQTWADLIASAVSEIETALKQNIAPTP